MHLSFLKNPWVVCQMARISESQVVEKKSSGEEILHQLRGGYQPNSRGLYMPIIETSYFSGWDDHPQLLGGKRPWHKNGKHPLQFAGFFDMSQVFPSFFDTQQNHGINEPTSTGESAEISSTINSISTWANICRMMQLQIGKKHPASN